MFNLKLKALNRFKIAKKILYLNKKRVCAQSDGLAMRSLGF